MKHVKFTKVHASGNDFILLDQRRRPGRLNYRAFARRYCARTTGIGADGVLVLTSSSKAAVKMRIFNADGSEAEMCGNGARCAALWTHKTRRKNDRKLTIETIAGIINAGVTRSRVKIQLTDPADIRMHQKLRLAGRHITVHYLNTGVPHTVIAVQGLANIDVRAVGRAVRTHPYFAPEGTNVNFIEPAGENFIRLRTYERGVESETGACGTGSAAAAIVADTLWSAPPPERRKIKVQTQSGEVLSITFQRRQEKRTEVWLQGRAEIVFNGTTETTRE
ncbi:MAG: diaminopimelate epimerase [Candidatus Omnitrophica bacterium]|nr:diaminopimelate epimerase [Candidatus Omnitrophota bacterium]